MPDSDLKKEARETVVRGTQESESRIHRVCVTCNNMFETDIEHIDAKYCPVCRRV